MYREAIHSRMAMGRERRSKRDGNCFLSMKCLYNVGVLKVESKALKEALWVDSEEGMEHDNILLAIKWSTPAVAIKHCRRIYDSSNAIIDPEDHDNEKFLNNRY